ncbi:MAG: DUF3052 domain-containing protein [Anaerolinea sp.]|nr:DUF3052 domain-containing protein [Anaerolinea sp.]
MAGYSGTPLPKKLGLKEGSRLALAGAHDGFMETLGGLPDGVALTAADAGAIDVIVCFVTAAEELSARFAELKPRLAYSGGLWIAWPKRSSGTATTLNENLVRDMGLAAGLVDNKVCAIDEQWSGLRFVYRLADRPDAEARR